MCSESTFRLSPTSIRPADPRIQVRAGCFSGNLPSRGSKKTIKIVRLLSPVYVFLGFVATPTKSDTIPQRIHCTDSAMDPRPAPITEQTHPPQPIHQVSALMYRRDPRPGLISFDFLVQDNSATGIPASIAVSGTQGGASNTSSLSGTATLVSTTPYTSGTLESYLGNGASPTDSLWQFYSGSGINWLLRLSS